MTRYFTTKIKTEDMVTGNGSDALVFCITEEKPSTPRFTEASVSIGYFLTWERAGEQAKAQTLPVLYVALSGQVKHYGDLFDVAAYERAAYLNYANRVNSAREGDKFLPRPIGIDQWLLCFRDEEAARDLDGVVVGWVDDPTILGDRDRYLQERASVAAPQRSTAQELLEHRRQQPVREEGIYQDANGDVFKVIRSNRGFLYAKQLVDGRFDFVSGAIKRLTAADKMSLAQAQQYGKLTNHCCRCGARLTDEDSIARGVGPVCASYF